MIKLLILVFILTGCVTQEHSRIQLVIKAKAVMPIMSGGRPSCTSFRTKYKGKYFIITNRHCCEGGANVFTRHIKNVLVVDKMVKKIIATHSNHDICVLESEKSELYLKLSNSTLKKYEPVRVIGYPYGGMQTLYEGFYAYFDPLSRAIRSQTQMMNGQIMTEFVIEPTYNFSVRAYPGNSGSPILNMKHEVVALLNAVSVSISQGVPVRYIKLMLDRIIANGKNN